MAKQTLYVLCTQCDEPIHTGISLTPEEFNDEYRTIGPHQVQCEKCGTMNLWSKTEMWPESVLGEKLIRKTPGGGQ
jgi:hypothetical protein